MSEPVSISSGIAARYATAIFGIAQSEGALDALASNIADLSAALAESEDLRAMIHSPLLSRAEQGQAIAAVATKMGLAPVMVNGLGLMAQKRRLFVLPQLLDQLEALIDRDRGVVNAEVTSAKAMTKAQSDKLARAMKAAIGSDVNINTTVDESLIGGLVVKVGSKMIDTSIRSRLAALKHSMKEVG